MTPGPVKRYRPRSRLRALDQRNRTELREKALELAQKGLNRRGGPVDKGSPAEQKAAADRLKNERAANLGEMERQKQVAGAKPQTKQAPDYRSFQLHKNTTGNARSGGLFRRVPTEGGEYHQYAGGKRVFVRKPPVNVPRPGSGEDAVYRRQPINADPNHGPKREVGPTEGTGNVSRPANRGSEDLANQLAKQVATQNRPKARRKLFARA